jgi:hypothetical protein
MYMTIQTRTLSWQKVQNVGALLAVIVVVAACQAMGSEFARVSFNREIRPILANKCFGCHGPDKTHRQAELRLDVKEGAIAELFSGGQAVVPGKPGESVLVKRILAADGVPRMPPDDSGESLSATQIELIRRWIEEGAQWEAHWSLAIPTRPRPPDIRTVDWPRSPIDRFVLARLEAESLEPTRDADRATLIRRLSFDLLGLPPTSDEVNAFVKDDTPDAYEKVVDRLLSSPHYGERLAMYWLDLVRYADTTGYHSDEERAISAYRDYVINSFNSNLSFDAFTTEQLAGDLLPNATREQHVASSYNMLGMTTNENGIQAKEYLAKYAADRVRNVSSVWMASTLGCAECHDHKFDPYTTRDFYRLAAFFADIRESGMYLPIAELALPSLQQERELKEADAQIKKAQCALSTYLKEPTALQPLADVKAILEVVPQNRSADQTAKIDQYLTTIEPEHAQLYQQLDQLSAAKARLTATVRHTIQTVSVEPRVTRVLPRGNWMDQSGEIVAPGVPECFSQLDVGTRRATRLDLARWLMSAQQPQTARVFVNRLWKLYFGTGLSRVLDDVGTRGEWPAHAELLDWLAVEFIDSGWNVKHIVRVLVTSRAYRQSSVGERALRDRDPFNRLVGRQSAFRLDAEVIRDNALAISGLLVSKIGGPSVKPYQPDGYYKHLNFPHRTYLADAGENQYRRGLYTHWQRSFLHPSLIAFDAPSREECTAERSSSNTPIASLVLLNDPSFVEAARVLAERIGREGGATFEERVEWAWRRATGRSPENSEIDLLRVLFTSDKRAFANDTEAAERLIGVGQWPKCVDLDVAELAAWTSITRAILNLSETITRN